jgi:hypothetical protein
MDVLSVRRVWSKNHKKKKKKKKMHCNNIITSSLIHLTNTFIIVILWLINKLHMQ